MSVCVHLLVRNVQCAMLHPPNPEEKIVIIGLFALFPVLFCHSLLYCVLFLPTLPVLIHPFWFINFNCAHTLELLSASLNRSGLLDSVERIEILQMGKKIPRCLKQICFPLVSFPMTKKKEKKSVLWMRFPSCTHSGYTSLILLFLAMKKVSLIQGNKSGSAVLCYSRHVTDSLSQDGSALGSAGSLYSACLGPLRRTLTWTTSSCLW